MTGKSDIKFDDSLWKFETVLDIHEHYHLIEKRIPRRLNNGTTYLMDWIGLNLQRPKTTPPKKTFNKINNRRRDKDTQTFLIRKAIQQQQRR